MNILRTQFVGDQPKKTQIDKKTRAKNSSIKRFWLRNT